MYAIGNSVVSLRQKREVARRNAEMLFAAREQRWTTAQQEVAAESAARDANTKRLRALRLARDEAGEDAARIVAQSAPTVKHSWRTLADPSDDVSSIPSVTARSE